MSIRVKCTLWVGWCTTFHLPTACLRWLLTLCMLSSTWSSCFQPVRCSPKPGLRFQEAAPAMLPSSSKSNKCSCRSVQLVLCRLTNNCSTVKLLANLFVHATASCMTSTLISTVMHLLSQRSTRVLCVHCRLNVAVVSMTCVSLRPGKQDLCTAQHAQCDPTHSGY